MDISTAMPQRGTSETPNALAKLSADYEAFLQLLTAQVANQDPLEPMDSSTYVTQLAQLSQVEQSVQTNERLSAISAQLAAASALDGTRLIGREIELDAGTISPGPGGADMRIRFDAPVAGYTLRLVDAEGVVVRELPGDASAGDRWHAISWDGRDAAGRATSAPVQAEVVASGPDGAAIPYDLRVEETVEAVRMGDEDPILVLRSGTEVGLSKVRAIG